MPLEQPECWVTGDSIGLFLETECQFPLESESEDECDYHNEEREFVPGFRRQGCGLTKFFVKKASLELIDLYRRFVSPANPRFCCTFSLVTFRGRWIAGPLHPGTAPYFILLHGAFSSYRACSRIWILSVLVSSPPPVVGPFDPEICRHDPRSRDMPLLIKFALKNSSC